MRRARDADACARCCVALATSLAQSSTSPTTQHAPMQRARSLRRSPRGRIARRRRQRRVALPADHRAAARAADRCARGERARCRRRSRDSSRSTCSATADRARPRGRTTSTTRRARPARSKPKPPAEMRIAAMFAVTTFTLAPEQQGPARDRDPAALSRRLRGLAQRHRGRAPRARRQRIAVALAQRPHGPEWETFYVPAAPHLLRLGDNVLAIEVHPSGRRDAPELAADVIGAPRARHRARPDARRRRRDDRDDQRRDRRERRRGARVGHRHARSITRSRARRAACKSAHVGPLRDRKQWFEPIEGPIQVLWWVPAGHIPTVEEAKDRLQRLKEHGPTQAAFTFRASFPPPSAEASEPADLDAAFCEWAT